MLAETGRNSMVRLGAALCDHDVASVRRRCCLDRAAVREVNRPHRCGSGRESSSHAPGLLFAGTRPARHSCLSILPREGSWSTSPMDTELANDRTFLAWLRTGIA